MKFTAGLLSIMSFLACISASAVASQTHASKPAKPASHPAAAHPTIKVAPADEYFGHLKMSILGIRNTLKDLAQKADYNPSNPEQIFGTAAFTEDALHEWEQKYPRDPWLAKTVAGLVHMYAKVPTAQGRAKMHAALAWLTSRYGKTLAIVNLAKAEVEAADKAILSPASAATAAPSQATGTAFPTVAPSGAPANAPAPVATNPPAPPKG
ncbi:MAG: hypothetical protein M3N19_04370 [Candidatus Eremiobacteraeota bacterium]|nr:hypothetical protein [Candidatus Eremiobacteraeota bacterium]